MMCGRLGVEKFAQARQYGRKKYRENTMSGNEIIVAFFALAFLAFCLTAVALYALSRDKDEIADKSVSGLHRLHLSTMSRAKPDEESDSPHENLDE